jgi:hypothetical protein
MFHVEQIVETVVLALAYLMHRLEGIDMVIAFVAVIVAGVAAPFFAYAWAIQHRSCPNCGASVSADPEMMRAFTGR